MDVIAGLASASQLLAYSHSTFQVLIKLYKQVKDGPVALRQRQNNVRVLLTAVDSLHKRPRPAHILDTLSELLKHYITSGYCPLPGSRSFYAVKIRCI
jgi:hypothetical protein